MTTDPSWLYSTIAQSSAAIVAIIGGFITASVLNLLAEKRSLTNQFRAKQADLQALDNNDHKMRYEIHPIDYKVQTETLVQIERDIERTKTEVSELKERLDAFSYPPNLKMGVYILGFLAVFGIILPVIVITGETFYSWLKWLVTSLFSLGIIGVFIYIAFQIKELRRSDDPTS